MIPELSSPLTAPPRVKVWCVSLMNPSLINPALLAGDDFSYTVYV